LIRFILNEKEISTTLPPGTLLLDFIRYHQNLKGTKIGCREGDCGACTVLTGELKGDEIIYRSVTSCLMAIGNAHGKHIVSIEGLNMSGLNPIQKAMCDEAGTQCGFCTPGFIVSLAGFCLSKKAPTYDHAIASINGNICRCTGYKSIERAASNVAGLLEERGHADPVIYSTIKEILPQYFNGIKERLKVLSTSTNGVLKKKKTEAKFLGGGTDLYVQQHETMVHADIDFLLDQPKLNGIIKQGNKCVIGASATVSDIIDSPLFHDHFPEIFRFIKLVSSTPIRNMATIAGNFVNASPIGDLTIFFLALDAQLVLFNGKKKREVALRKFYKGYKTIDKKPEEYIETIWFNLPAKEDLFNFEKVSKRTHLDIASVNSAISISLKKDKIVSAGLSAGGVGPIPLYLAKTSEFLDGKKLSEELIEAAIENAQKEISPISDARGSEEYKRLLLSQLIKAHFITLFPHLQVEKLLAIDVEEN
jgi:xanthine dehydrogenase small subunit